MGKGRERFFSLGNSRAARQRSMTILVGAFMLAVSFCFLYLVSYVHLIIKYGWHRIRSEQLRFTSLKPRFVVSNGDVFSTGEMLLDVAVVFILMAVLMVFVVVPVFHRVVGRKHQNG